MKKLMFLFAMLSLGTLCWAGSERQDAVDRLSNAAKVLHEIMAAPDQRISEEIMKRAKCVAVIPHLMKGGFVFGAEHGKGVATCRTAKGWSAPAFIKIAGGSWGTQIGVEAVDLVMVIKSNKGMQKLLSSKFEIGRDGIGSSGTSGTAFLGKHRLEAGYTDPNLLSCPGCFCWGYIRGCIGSCGQQFQARHVRAQGHYSGHAAGSSGSAGCSTTVPGRGQGSKSTSDSRDCKKVSWVGIAPAFRNCL